MQKTEIFNKLERVKKLLDNNDISTSFQQLEDIARLQKDFKLLEEINHLKEIYSYMASYLINNQLDNSRETVYSDTIDQLKTIVDKINRDIVSLDSSDSYSESFRYNKLTEGNFDSLLSQYAEANSEIVLALAAENDTSDLAQKLEQLQKSIFNLLWTSLGDKKIIATATHTVTSGRYGEVLPFHIISAFILSLNNYFDRYKFEALLDIYEAEISEGLCAHALVGILLTIHQYPDRIKGIPALILRLKELVDSLMSYRRVREVIMAIIRTRDTERVASKMKEEVMPELMKLRPDILKKLREGSIDSLDSEVLESNPEWEELLNKSGLTKKMQELSEMQSEGADLMMVAFSNLKQFPFFNSVSNWFLPFVPYHSEINGLKKEKDIIEKLFQIGKNICDSDKYSLAIALSKMPDAQKNIMFMQLEAQIEQASEEMADKSLKSSTPEFDNEVTKVVRDLYRFFKLFRNKKGFNDPFIKPFNFLDIPVISELVGQHEIVSLIGEFYFSRGYYSEALSLFSLLLDEASDDSALWEKIGFCYQSLKFYDNARDSYLKAELLKTPSRWLLSRLAYVNKKTKNFSSALKYYIRLLDKDSDNVKLLTNAGYCALESGDIEEALGYYHHANYLESNNASILRAIAWCEFLNRNFEKSYKYYEKIINDDPLPSDYLNIGHLFLLKSENRKALSYYKSAAKNNYSDFRKTFLSDLPTLEKMGINKNEALIILDSILLDL